MPFFGQKTCTTIAIALALGGLTVTVPAFGYAGSAGGPNTFTSSQAELELARDSDPIWRSVFSTRQPSAPISSAVLGHAANGRGPAVMQRGNVLRKEIAITFDDGPHPGKTEHLLDVLRAYHVPATFFVVGEMAERYPDLIREEVAHGDSVGNHTYHHVSLVKISPADDVAEIAACGDVLKSVTGKRPYLFRPPGGRDDLASLDAAGAQGYTTVLWTDDPGDYASPGVDAIVERTMHCARPGGIILLHDGIQQTIDALPRIIDSLRARGFNFVTVDKMLHDRGTRLEYPALTAAESASVPVVNRLPIETVVPRRKADPFARPALKDRSTTNKAFRV